MAFSAFAVPGIEPEAGTVGVGSVGYRGAQLAALPPVAAVLDRFPAELIALAGPDEIWEEFPITRAALAGQVHISTEVETSEVLRADEMMAWWLAAILAAHRAYARHLGRVLPY